MESWGGVMGGGLNSGKIGGVSAGDGEGGDKGACLVEGVN